MPGPYAISTKCVTPAACARSKTCVRSLSKRLSARWQWVSIIMIFKWAVHLHGRAGVGGGAGCAVAPGALRRAGALLEVDAREQDLRLSERARGHGAEAR